MPIGRPTPEALPNPSEDDSHALERLTTMRWDSGYSTQQRTRPQTLGYGLVDSPVGQMAWIIEKFWSWMDCDDHPENVLTRRAVGQCNDLLVDCLELHPQGCIGSFAEALEVEKVEIPTGVASFQRRYSISKTWCEGSYNVTHWTRMPKGGHFGALSNPSYLSKTFENSSHQFDKSEVDSLSCFLQPEIYHFISFGTQRRRDRSFMPLFPHL